MAPKITLDMRIPNGLASMPNATEDEKTWTLQEAVDQLKKQRMTRLLKDDDDASEQLWGFRQAVQYGNTPTIGQVWAAYYVAATDKVWDEYLDEDGTVTERQFGARKAAITRLVFRKKY